MTLAIAITANAVLAVAMLSALAFVMTRPRRLRPHTPALAGRHAGAQLIELRPAAARGERMQRAA
jgi:hypothetical protein